MPIIYTQQSIRQQDTMSEETTEKYEFSDEDLDNFMEKALAGT